MEGQRGDPVLEVAQGGPADAQAAPPGNDGIGSPFARERPASLPTCMFLRSWKISMVRYTMSCTVSCPIRHRDAVLTSRAACWAWGPPNGPGAIPDAASGGVDMAMARLRPQAGGARGRGQGGRPPPVLPASAAEDADQTPAARFQNSARDFRPP